MPVEPFAGAGAGAAPRQRLPSSPAALPYHLLVDALSHAAVSPGRLDSFITEMTRAGGGG